MDDNRNFGQNNQNRDRNRDHRNDGGRRFRHSGGRPNFQQNRGRPQRPLLTSALNGAGLCLVALVALARQDHPQSHQLIGAAVVAFGLSAFVSYFAQRVKFQWVEKISDLFFLIGVVLVVWVGTHLSGILSL